MATPSRSPAICASRASRPGRSRRRSRGRRRIEALRPALRGAGPHDLDQREGRGPGLLLLLGPARGRRLGGLVPDRPAAQALPPRTAARGLGHGGGPCPGLALRGVVLRASGTSRRRSPWCWTAEASRSRGGDPSSLPLDGGAAAAPARPAARGAARAGDRLVAGPAALGDVRAQQAAHGRAARRGLADAGRAGPGPGGRRAPACPGPPADGHLGAHGGVLRAAALAGGRRRGGRLAPLSVLPGLAARPAGGVPGRSPGVAGGVEVGRHPGAAHPAGRRRPPLVARRGADHGALPRADPGSGVPAAGRHGPGRRDPRLA